MNKQKLPEGWKEVELKDIGQIVTGSTPPKINPEYYGDSIPWIKPPDLNHGMYVSNSKEKISEIGRSKVRILPKGSIIVSCIGIIGKVAIAECELCTNQQINGIIPNIKIADSKFIYYLIKKIKPILEKRASSAVVPLLNKSEFSKVKINLPPLETQKKIVSILEKADKTKEWRKEADELTKDFLKSVFLEMFGDKSKFELVTLNDIANLSMGGTPSTKEKAYWENGTVNWMKSGDIKGNYISSIPQTITELGHEKSNTHIFPEDTVVIALNGQGKTRGTTAILKVETTSNQSVVGIMIDKNKISSEYLHYNLKTRYSEIRNLTGDSDRSGLNLSILRSFKIPLPPIKLQNKFASIVKEVEAMKEHQKESKQELDNFFNILMQKAFKKELII
ncbi:MAG: restriction endonuclease subunit S [Nanoarchaeota archaeon]|nr:restriction endonuclease subunit S [Nanoarchaeota archaeon]